MRVLRPGRVHFAGVGSPGNLSTTRWDVQFDWLLGAVYVILRIMEEQMERPQLRSDLQVLEQGDGVLLYDPARRDFFEVAPADRPVLRLLDGSRTVGEIAREAGRPVEEVWELLDDLSDLLLLADPEQEELLHAYRSTYAAEDLLLRPILDSQPPPSVLTEAVAVVDEATYTCLGCGDCCHYAVPVSTEERRLLETFPWSEEVIPSEAGRLFLMRPAIQWDRLEETIATRSDPTRCAFLDAHMRCRVHQEMGAPAKPFPCRLFPLAYPVLVSGRVIFSFTFECPNLYRTYAAGALLPAQRESLAALAAEMEEVYALPERIPLDEGKEIARAEYLSWEEALLATVGSPAGNLEAFLGQLRQAWRRLLPAGPDPVPGVEGLARLAGHLGQVAHRHRQALAESPEGEEGSAWAVHVLERLAGRPEEAWSVLPWADVRAADLFLGRFLRHFVEGKQMLLYRPLFKGVQVLALLLLLARSDAAMMAQGADVSLALLNRALARWERLLDIRPFRVAFLREVS